MFELTGVKCIRLVAFIAAIKYFSKKWCVGINEYTKDTCLK